MAKAKAQQAAAAVEVDAARVAAQESLALALRRYPASEGDLAGVIAYLADAPAVATDTGG